MAVKKNVDVNFRVRGGGKVPAEGKKAQKAINEVGDASKDADDQGKGLADRWRDMSRALDQDLNEGVGGALVGFDRMAGIVGQVGNAFKVLSGFAILELVTSIGGMIEQLTGSKEALEEQKKAAEAASKAYEELASAIESAEKEAKLAAFRSSIEFQESVVGADKVIASTRLELAQIDQELRVRRAEQAALDEKARKASAVVSIGGSADRAIDARNIAAANEKRTRELLLERIKLQDDLAAAEVERENTITDAARAEERRLKEIAKNLGIEEEKRKGAALATKAQTDALADHVAMLLEFEAASSDADALLIEENAQRFAAAFGERVQAAADAGAEAIARARQEAEALSLSLADGARFAEVFAEAVAPLENIVDGFAQGAAAAAIEVAFFGANALAEINALATSVFRQAAILTLFELGKGIARSAVGDEAGAAAHFAASKIFAATAAIAAAGAAATGGLGASQGDAGGGALPQPTRQDFGASNDDQERRGDTFVIVQGDNYDSELARDAALGRRAIRGANHLAARPGGPRLAARAIR